MEDVQSARRAQKGAETNTSLLQRTTELTGFQWNNKEERKTERRRKSVSSDKALVSARWKTPQSRQPLCVGDTTIGKSGRLFLLALKRKKRLRGRERGLPSHLSLHPYQSTSAQLSNSYKRFPMLLWKGAVLSSDLCSPLCLPVCTSCSRISVYLDLQWMHINIRRGARKCGV